MFRHPKVCHGVRTNRRVENCAFLRFPGRSPSPHNINAVAMAYHLGTSDPFKIGWIGLRCNKQTPL